MTATIEQAPAASAAGALGGSPARRRRNRTGLPLRAPSGSALGLVVLWLSLLVILPLAAVVGHAFDNGWGGFWSEITQHQSAAALRLTIGLALAVAVVNGVMGTLVAWVLVRDRPRGGSVFEMVIDIPFALPTVVAGLVMLVVYGNNGFGPTLLGTRWGLFVTLLFVTLPFTVRTVQPVLLDLDRDAEQAAASLGANGPTVFRRIVLPQLMPAVASGAALAFARALGEYGSLVFIAGSIGFAPQLIYGKVQDTGAHAEQQAAALATVLLLASAIVLILLDVLQRRVARRG
jgi:sulfate transport system permease protein